MTRLVVILALLAGGQAATGAVSGTQPTTRPFRIQSDERGQLALTVTTECPTFGPGWSLDQVADWRGDDCGWELTLTDPPGWFSGRTVIRQIGRTFSVSAWRYTSESWRVTSIDLTQAPGLTTAWINLRTPSGMSDWQFDYARPLLADIIRDAPEVRVMLNEALAPAGGEWREGEYLVGLQTDYQPPGWMVLQVNDAVERLSSCDWRVRERASGDIEQHSWRGAICLRRMTRAGWTTQQSLSADLILSAWPKAE